MRLVASLANLCRTIVTMAEGYLPGTHSVAFVTVPNIEVGKKIAHGAVEKKLASSVNIIPSVTSVYYWQGKVEEKSELFMVVKTSTENVPDLTKFVRENHPYVCPQVISMKFSFVHYVIVVCAGILISTVSASLTRHFLQDLVQRQLPFSEASRESKLLQSRIKRGLLAGAVDIDQCTYFCQDNSSPSPLPQAPIFSNCPPDDLQPVYYANKGERNTVVTWSPPTANDNKGFVVEVTELTSPVNGGIFDGLTAGLQHRILYEAINSDGLRAYCQFNVTVKVRTCPMLPWTDSGQIVCSKGNIYGSTCTIQCRDGYSLTGNASVTCEEDGFWSGVSSCSKTRCPEPSALLHGSVTCNDDNHYQSICSFTCNKGFALEGPMYSQCQSDQTWSHDGEQSCKDIEPPVLECLTPQIFHADKGLSSTTVIWLAPSAHDNLDQQPNITKIQGPLEGDRLPTGRTLVTYQANDEAGNISPVCSIELKILEITCEHPGKIITDGNIRFDCSDTVLYYGVSCSLSCDYNLPLEGSATITCDKTGDDGVNSGTWKWGSSHQPYCRDIACPPLDEPANGKLNPDSLNGDPIYIIKCNENYALPHLGSSFNGHMYCVQGSWTPFNFTPDCVAHQKPSHLSLPAKLYYYYSTICSEADLRQKFLVVVSDVVHPLFKTICPDDITCSLEHVEIECGNGGKRKKRDLVLGTDTRYDGRSLTAKRTKREDPYAAVVSFAITTQWPADNSSFSAAIALLDDLAIKEKAGLAGLVSNGSLNIDGYTLRNDSFTTPQEWGNITCGPGLILDRSQCEPCPRGMYLNETSGKCEFCPIGQYQDSEGNITCKRCPQGYSTLSTGSRHSRDCIQLCQPGYASVTTMEPCTKCRIGNYQESAGRTACMACPRGQTTSLPGSSNHTECQNFDVLIHGTITDTVIGSVTATQTISVSLRVKLLKQKTLNTVTIKLMDGQRSIMSFMMSAMSTVALGDTLETKVNLTTDKWVHIAVVASTTLTEIYINENKNVSQTAFIPSQTPVSVILSSSQSEGILISGFQITSQLLSEGDVTAASTSCTALVAHPVITMEDFLTLEQGNVNFVTPSVCDAVDDCSASPCGDHECVNEVDGFRCICSNHMTGRFCERPPDFCTNNDCQHNSTCNTLHANYTCDCVNGFTGVLCDLKEENATWSDYDEWSSCSVSCEIGVRTRTRSCYPPTSTIQCDGDAVETEACNRGPCRECLPLSRDSATVFNCTRDDTADILTCRQVCQAGWMIPAGFELLYTCGIDTNYEWAPFSYAPTCIAPMPPENIGLDVSCGYNEPIPVSAEDTVENQIKENLSETTCTTDDGCAASVTLDSADGGVSVAKISMAVALLSSNNLDIDGYVSSGTMNVALQEVVNAVVLLEHIASVITVNPSSICDVTVGDYTYHSNTSMFFISSAVDCPRGSVPSGGLCVKCPVGTRADADSCVFCDVTTYQDEVGQHSCKSCPSGFKTQVMGATSVAECTEMIQGHTDVITTAQVTTFSTSHGTTAEKSSLDTSPITPHTSTMLRTAPGSATTAESAVNMTGSPNQLPSSIPEGQDNISTFGIGAIVGIVLGALAVLLSLLAVIIVLFRSRKRKHPAERDRGLSFDNLYILDRDTRSGRGQRESGDYNSITTTYDELPPPYSYDTDSSLRAVTSFTNYTASKDYTTDDVTDYLSPKSASKGESAESINGLHARSSAIKVHSQLDPTYLHPGSSGPTPHDKGIDCEQDITYLHARSSTVNDSEEHADERYATIPLK